ncbi:GNAT family N-acetyltransferase [Saccharibacillus sp. CPCC 101409]|uniref:GNAT family N-acetyltransferase n=1 Tax=Saccharibacillus sp. CPCC 101409 TaxID=3058041 RepID=UPI00267167F1|nr:GNAT family N-acetyltransferase [Saccharibacillus sp. CPCC 101409]MDO3410760.1 GNAT family N-acetyltransferase [Saccharibacillus sp. CPCC 101409]
MLQSVKQEVRDPRVAELLALAVFPDPEQIERALKRYEEREDRKLFAYVEDGEKLGVIGFEPTGDKEITLTHIAVGPEHRGLGYGRGMVLELMVQEQPERVVAETDEEAVDFYRSLGFSVIGLGVSSSGLERYRCVYTVDEPEED